ncbi:APC family permease, partial [bacterium]|nr:APC family permease [bacterium]
DLLGYLGLTLSLCAAASVFCLFQGKNRNLVKGWKRIPPIIFVSATLISAVLLTLRDPWQALGTAVTLVVGALGYFSLKGL